jgi:hypothetical protein
MEHDDFLRISQFSGKTIRQQSLLVGLGNNIWHNMTMAPNVGAPLSTQIQAWVWLCSEN